MAKNGRVASMGAVLAMSAGVLPAQPSPVPDPLGEPGVTVLVFTRTDCPISNRYVPELRRLHRRHASSRVRFYRVYPDAAETADAVARHARDFDVGFGSLRDPDHALVGRAGATVTPEVAVFRSDGGAPRLLYRGRIDDRALDFGRVRGAPRRRDLDEVLSALARGAEVEPRTTPAVGCALPRRP